MTWEALLKTKMPQVAMTQRGLARALTEAGVETSYQTVQTWLKKTGTTKPQPRHYAALVSLLNISADEFVQVTGVAAGLGVAGAAALAGKVAP